LFIPNVSRIALVKGTIEILAGSIRIWKRTKLSSIFYILPLISFQFLNMKMYSVSRHEISAQYQTTLSGGHLVLGPSKIISFA